MEALCPLCQSPDTRLLYTSPSIAVLMNRVCGTFEAAQQAPQASMQLAQCERCQHCFLQDHRPQLIDFDALYNNEQTYSPAYREFLTQLIDQWILPYGARRIVEIGCGRGYILEQLKARGCDVLGFDPVYDGESPWIVPEPFAGQRALHADIILLRHVLDEVPFPLQLLQLLAEANQRNGHFVIELLDFQQVLEHGAFWDLSYERSHYFTAQTLASMFSTSRIERCFGGQYLRLIAPVDALQQTPLSQPSESPQIAPLFVQKVEELKALFATHAPLVIWGASNKGGQFASQCDPTGRWLRAIIDIYPGKQGQWLPGVGLPIWAPEQLLQASDVRAVFVANPNYLEEIRQMLKPKEFLLLSPT